MSQKTTALIVLVLLIGVGFLAGSFLGGFVKQWTAPQGHSSIINGMKIAVTYATPVDLQPEFLKSSSATWTLSVLSDNFQWSKTYSYSLWVYSCNGDPEVYVCIWGPGNDGKTFMVELCSSADRKYRVVYGSTNTTFAHNTYFAVQVS